jgi:hypothetical protein
VCQQRPGQSHHYLRPDLVFVSVDQLGLQHAPAKRVDCIHGSHQPVVGADFDPVVALSFQAEQSGVAIKPMIIKSCV